MSNQVSELHPQVEKCLDQFGIVHTVFSCDPELADTARFCEHYGFQPAPPPMPSLQQAKQNL